MVDRASPDPLLVPEREVSGLRLGNPDAMTAPGSPNLPAGPGAPDAHPTADDVAGTDARHLVDGRTGLGGAEWTDPSRSAGDWQDVG